MISRRGVEESRLGRGIVHHLPVGQPVHHWLHLRSLYKVTVIAGLQSHQSTGGHSGSNRKRLATRSLGNIIIK